MGFVDNPVIASPFDKLAFHYDEAITFKWLKPREGGSRGGRPVRHIDRCGFAFAPAESASRFPNYMAPYLGRAKLNNSTDMHIFWRPGRHFGGSERLRYGEKTGICDNVAEKGA